MTDASVAVVGAGVAGVGAAYALRDDAGVVLFEERDRIGGRAATRGGGGCVYDYGANYVSVERGTDLASFVRSLGTDGLVDVEAPVWTFDREGEIEPGREGDDHAFTYERGIAEFPRRVLERAGASLRTETTVESLVHEDGQWTVIADGASYGPYDAVVLTPPAPRTADLLARSEWEHPRGDELVDAIGAVPYRTVVSVALHYPFELALPYYALVNADKEHEVGWVSREECKRGHVPGGECLLIAQMAPERSAERYDDPTGEVVDEIAARVAALLDDDRLVDPDWTDCERWHYALPDEGLELDEDVRKRAESSGLYLAGDWVVGRGRIARALESGLDVGDRAARSLGE